MKTITASLFALGFLAAASAQAAGTTLTTAPVAATIASTTTVASVGTWKGQAGTYEAFAPLNADQQDAELRGSIPASQANTTLPDTLTKLPAYSPGAEVLPYGYGNTDVLTTVRQSEACPTTPATPVAHQTQGAASGWP